MSTPNRYQPGAWKPAWKVARIRWRLARGLARWGGYLR